MAEQAEIIVEIVNKAKRDIDKIRTEFKKLQAEVRRIKSNVDVDDNGSIQKTNQQLNRMARDRMVNIYTKASGLGKNPMHDPPDTPINRADAFGKSPEFTGGAFHRKRARSWAAAEKARFQATLSASRKIEAHQPNFGERMRGSVRRFTRMNLGQINKKAGGMMQKMGERVRGAIPTYGQLLAIFAALVPMLVTLAAGALGVATAFGAVAGAGAAMVGLGLLGRGDTMAESLKNARRQLGKFKEDLFTAVQPVARAFAPFSEAMLGILPSEIAGISSELTGLDVFQGDFLSGTRGFVQWIGEGAAAMAEFQPIMSELLSVFGPIVGDNIINFFKFLTKEAYDNQNLLIALGGTFKDIIVMLYEFSVLFSKVAVSIRPVFDVLAALTELMNNRMTVALATIAAGFFGMLGAIKAATAALAAYAAVKAFVVALTAPQQLAVALGTTAVAGLALNEMVKGTRSASTSALSAGSGNTFNSQIVVQGDMTDKNRREIETMWDRRYGSVSRVNNNMTTF